MNIGVFSCDPGGHTGLAWAIFDPKMPTSVDEMFRGRLNAGSETVTGSERDQIRTIMKLWHSFCLECVKAGVPLTRVWFVMENFILKPGETAGGDDATSPLCLIWGVEGYRMGLRDSKRGPKAEVPGMILQMASEAKSYGTGPRLKAWGVWVVGREHERSAWSHVAFFLKKYLIQGIG